jgi:hypothetical protein
MFGRHFGVDDRLISHISSRSVDVIRTNYWVSCIQSFLPWVVKNVVLTLACVLVKLKLIFET